MGLLLPDLCQILLFSRLANITVKAAGKKGDRPVLSKATWTDYNFQSFNFKIFICTKYFNTETTEVGRIIYIY